MDKRGHLTTDVANIKSIREIFSRRIIYRWIKIIAFLLILYICFGEVYHITKRKEEYTKMHDFFEQEEEFDVLFFGSSHVIDGVFPMQLWNDYGIISHNMGKGATFMAGTYYNMLLACKIRTPKMIVIDTYAIGTDNKIAENRNYIHSLLDDYPISYTKYLAIKDLFDGKNLLNNEIEYLFNFSMYHARWDEIDKGDFVYQNKCEKGAVSTIGVAAPAKMKKFEDVDIYNEAETVNMEYLRRMIEYCKEKNIEILVTYIPHPASDASIAASKYVQKICDEYEVNYINFLNTNIVNYDTDCYDATSHLNPSGAKKVTDYLGKYIIDNYNLPDQRKNEKYNSWYKDYDTYIDFKIENLKKNEKNLNNYLMLLYGEKDIKYEIKISSKKEIKDGSTLQKLLVNLENNYQVDDLAFEKQQDKTIKITTYDNRNNKLIQTVWF